MPDTEYRLFLNNEAASLERLQRLETISVEQEVDMAWEARIEIPICVDDKGSWTREDQDFVRSFGRVRIEVRVGQGTFVALIDGPVVGYDSRMTFEPGQSTITAVVRDDSVYLNRREHVEVHENMLDHEIAQRLFNDTPQIASSEVDTTPAHGDLPPVVVQRDTAMQLMRRLAQRQGMHAYVLPGASPGESVGYFRPFPTSGSGSSTELPELILLGKDRNMRNFDVTRNAEGPATTRTSTLSITDQQVVTSTASFRDRQLLGDGAALEQGVEEAEHLLPPTIGTSVDPDQATAARAADSAYAFEASGSILEGCYGGVLQPYKLVPVKIGETPLSGVYLVTRVSHRLTRSVYSQQFTVRRDAQSQLSGGPADLIGSIF